MKAKPLYQKDTKNKFYLPLTFLLTLFFLYISTGNIVAQATHPCYENPNCTSNDFELEEVYLASDANGTPLTSAACNMGGPAVTYVALDIQNTTSSGRDGIYITGTIVSGNQSFPIEYCFDVSLPQNQITTLTIPAPNTFNWDCQSAVTIEDALVVWSTSSQEMCPGNMIDCGPTTPAKCSFYTGSQPVNTPLVANFEFENSCIPGNMFESVSFTSTTVGGVPPYAYSWSFGTGSSPSSSINAMETVDYNSTGSRMVTLTVTDDDGNTDDITQEVVIGTCCNLMVTCPSDQTYDCDNVPSTASTRFSDGGGNTSNACGTVTIEDDFSHTGACGGDVTVTYTITDDMGTPSNPNDDNIEMCEQTITINPAPQASFTNEPQDETIECSDAPPSGQMISYSNGASGNCEIEGEVMSTISGSHDECGGEYTESWSFTDACGNTINGSRTITVNPAPQATFTNEPEDETIECSDAPPSGQMISYSNGASGNCEIEGEVMSTISGSHDECGGEYTESWSFTDACGNTINGSRTITVNPAPQATFTNEPEDETIECSDAPPSGQMISFSNSASGNCEIKGEVMSTISGSHDECGGEYTESWSFTDACGNTINGSRTITVNPAPQATFTNEPEDETIECSAAPPTGQMISFSNGASGNCEIEGEVMSTISGSHDECGGEYTESWSFTDACGNTINGSRTITVNPAPQATFTNEPEDETIECSAAPPTGQMISYSNGASGNCEIEGEVMSTISGSHDECGGEYTESWSFTDACGNTINGSRTITVNPAPQATFTNEPEDETIECSAAPPTGQMISYSNDADGNCEIEGEVMSTISGSHDECGGEYTESWSFTDACGNTINGSRTITVNPAPQASFTNEPQNETIECSAAPPTGQMVTYSNSASGSCLISGQVMSSISGSHDECGGTYTESWTFTDECERTINGSRTITVNPAPQASFTNEPQNETIECSAAPPTGQMITYSNSASGSCLISGQVMSSISGSHDECGGTYTESWTFTDACERTINGSRTITVNPAPQASFTNEPQNETIECSAAPPTGQMITYSNSASGSCLISGQVMSSISGSHDECGGTYTESWTFTDACERTINGSRTITVNPAPQASFTNEPQNETIECSAAPPTGQMITYSNSASGSCLISGQVMSSISGSHDECGGTYTESWTFTDACERTINGSRTITVNPAPQASFTNEPQNETIECSAAPPTGQMITYSNSASGSCLISGQVMSSISGSHDECGGTYTESWTFTDACERTINGSRTITVNPAPQASFTNEPQNETIECSAAPPTGQMVTYSNSASGSCLISGQVMSSISGSHDECGGTYTESWTFTDACERTINGSRTITVNPAPQASFTNEPQNETIECSAAPPTGQMITYSNSASGSCLISGQVMSSISGSHDECGGTYTESWTFTDACERTINGSRTITVNPAPQASFTNEPQNETIECSAAPPTGQMVTYSNSASGSCLISGQVMSSISGSHDECGGTYTESWTFTDACERTINGSRTITVNPAPQASFTNEPQNETIECSAAPPTGQMVTYSNSASGSCLISGQVMSSISGSHDECGGTYTESWTFTDACERTINGSRTITVNPAPQASFTNEPQNETIECSAAPPTGQMVTYSNSASGSCLISGQVMSSISGSHDECGGTYTESWTFTDACERTINGSRTITVNPAPQASFTNEPQNETIECSAAPPTGQMVTYSNSASGSCLISGQVMSSISGSHDECGGTYTESWTFTDACERTINGSRTITVNPAPQASFTNEPQNETIECSAAPPTGQMVTYSNSASGSCLISGQVMSSISGSHDECGGTYTESWTFTDACERTINGSRTITVNPAPQASFTNEPQNETIECSAAPPTGQMITYSNSASGSCLISGQVMSSISGSHDECGGTYTESWTFTDACERTINGSRTITVNPAPQASFTNEPQNETIECSAAPPTGQMVTYSNSASGSCLISGQVMSSISGSHDECGGTYTESWSFTDACERTINGSRTITVNPAPEPVFTDVENITIDCSEGIPQSTSLTYDNGEEGSCEISGEITSTIEELNGNTLASQIETRDINVVCPRVFVETWSYTNGCNQVITASRTITMVDNEPPFIAVNSEKVIDCDDAAVFDRPIIRDNCDDNLDIDVDTDYFISGAVCRHKRTWTVTDDCGNQSTASQIIIIEDDTPPVLKPVHPLLAGLEDGDTMYFECNKPVYFSPDDFEVVSECKNCPQNYRIHMDDFVNYYNCENGTNAIKEIVCWWYATDKFGNKSSYTIHMFALDRMPPDFISVPSDKTIGCNDPVNFGKPIVEDACSDKVTLTHLDEIIETEGGSAVRRTWTATDKCGNSSTASQTITINGSMPVFTNIPEDKTQPFGSNPQFDTPMANSSCGNISIQIKGEDEVLGDMCNGFTHIRTWEAVSDQGLTATTSQTITIGGDTEGPVISNPPADLILPCDSEIPDYQLEATDNSGQPVEISVETTVSRGDCDRMGMRNWTLTDACGNTTLFTQMVYFSNESNLFFSSVPMDVALEFGDTPSDIVPTVVTNCDDDEINMNLTIDTLENSDCELVIQKMWIASDNCDNADTAYQEITFEDHTAPQFSDDIESEIAIECGEQVEFTEPVVTDNVEVSSLTFEDENQIEGCEGFIQRTWTAEDLCGNISTLVQRIELIPDVTSPDFDRRDSVILLSCNDSIPEAIAPIVSDNCTQNIQVEFSEIIEGENCQLIIDRKWTATDSCGNISILSERYILRDTLGPEFNHTPEDKVVSCDEDVIFDEEVTATDNCTADGDIEILVNDVRKDGTCAEGYTMIRTWRAFDNCDNMSEISQSIQVLGDSIGPVLTYEPADTIIRCGDTIPDSAPEWTNTLCSEITVDKTVSFTTSDTTNCNNGEGYYIIQTWIARDICGISDTVKQYIAVLAPGQDHLMAFVHTPSTKVADCAQDVQFGSPIVKSTCDSVMVQYEDDTVGMICSDDYRFIRTWTATDTCGQTVSEYQTVLIRPDTTLPIITVLNDTLYMTSSEYEDWDGAAMNIELFDNCGIDSAGFTISTKEIDDNLAYVYTYDIYDNCHNSVVDSFFVVVTDSEPQVNLIQSNNRIYSEVLGGQKPYHFKWEYQLLGASKWTHTDQGQDFFNANGMSPLSKVKVIVTDSRQHRVEKVLEFAARKSFQTYFTVFPNPAESYVNVKFDAGQNHKNTIIKVFNMIGQQIYFREYGKELGTGLQNISINTFDWPSGPYVLHLNTGSMSKNQKLIITK